MSSLRWLYVIALLPVITDLLETGGLPTTPREWTSELILGLVVIVIVNFVIRQRERLATETRSHARSEQQLQHAQRLTTVGQLAAGVAHELGSPLQVVAGRAKMVATGEAAGPDAKESGQIILEQAHRMTRIIRGLLDFARRQPAQRSAADLNDIAQDTVRLLAPTAKKKAVVLELEADGSGLVQVDVLQIQQALTNLVMNAIQAVSTGGHVTIGVHVQRVSPPADLGGPEADHACLSVRDDGPGIAEADRLRIFEPFFTTKDVGEGTGLGLSVAHGLVRENGGWIAVESEVGRATCFSVCLPCRAASGPQAS